MESIKKKYKYILVMPNACSGRDFRNFRCWHRNTGPYTAS